MPKIERKRGSANLLRYTIAIDFSVLFHIAHSIASKAPAEYGLMETICFHADNKLKSIRRELEQLQVLDYEVLMVEDRVPQRKLDLYPPYRGDRVGDMLGKSLLKQHMVYTKTEARFCASLGEEADDALATIAKQVTARGEGCIIVSRDKDMHQLIANPLTWVYDPVNRKFVTEDDCLKSFNGLPSTHIPLHKTLWGDSGDCVPNVLPRMQKQILPVVSQTDGGLDSFWEYLQQKWPALTPRCQSLIRCGEEQITINEKLVRLKDDCEIVWEES